MKRLQMQGIKGLFSVTAIFLAVFLINLLKIQKIHFFLMLIYIIIEGAKCVPAVSLEETPQEISREIRSTIKKRRQRSVLLPGRNRKYVAIPEKPGA